MTALGIVAFSCISVPASAQTQELRDMGRSVTRSNASRDAADSGDLSSRLLKGQAPQDDESIWFYLGLFVVCAGVGEVVRQSRREMCPRYTRDEDEYLQPIEHHARDFPTGSDALMAFAHADGQQLRGM
jgi:hypothetical protein